MLAPDSNLGPYRLIARVGAGGMGEVWKAEDTRLGRVVAIKVLPPAVAADAEAVARLKREARTAAQLYHPNVATIHSIEQDGDRLFIVEEFVEGEPLSQRIRRGALPEAEICRIGRAVADALAEAHAKGIVHRDIKPDNILVSGQRVKVLDFGIAKQVGLVEGSPDAATAPFMTQQGMILGTIQYMSPEQALGKPLDGRTDIFSLGIVLYEAATGRLPFGGETVTETMTQIIRDEPPPVTATSPGLAAVIAKCLKKNREERFRDAGELAAALEQQSLAAPTVVTTPRTELIAAPRKRMLWPWFAVVVAAIAAALLLARRQEKPAVPAPAPVVTTTTAAPPPSTATQTVTAAPVLETVAPVVKKAAPAVEKPPVVEPPPVDRIDAREHLRLGGLALRARDFPTAERELQLALEGRDQLNEMERRKAERGLIAARKREQGPPPQRGPFRPRRRPF